MFYVRKENTKIYIWDDKIKGQFWPFVWAFCKNFLYWKNIHDIRVQDYPPHKFALWFTENRVFILDENSNLEILNFKK